jgi:hypothetical protein
MGNTMKVFVLAAGAALAVFCTSCVANAQTIYANEHAPIGVMGDHMHETGEWMLSYRYMHMGMNGNRIGTDGVSPETIVTTIPNRFFGTPMQPPTLRVVPQSMDMDMHMAGGMYAPTDWLTLMAMGMYATKKMRHITFQGAAGTTQLGTFTARASGFGDTSVTGLVRLFEDAGQHWHLNAGVDLPTGSNTRSGTVLAPTGATPNLRLPYAMQLGGGTYDLKPGVTYTGMEGAASWGAQYLAYLPLGKNGEGYAFGNAHMLTAWVAYAWEPWISTSARLYGETRDPIRGIDPQIVAPVQTADPANYGGERLDIFFGVNLVGQSGALYGHRLAFEIGFPLHQDLNGPQMKTDWQMTLGWQKAF